VCIAPALAGALCVALLRWRAPAARAEAAQAA
jgi:hypothetical protein